MKVASKIEDGRIDAVNVLFEVTIQDYLNVAKDIIKNNEFQRKRVRSSSTIYALLKKDLRSNCTIPPIVLAIKSEKLQAKISIDEVTDELIQDLFKPENLIILDGLQRTYTLIDLETELQKESDEENTKRVMSNKLRVEIYLGINKIAILYRMLTLNTGQTPMSIRHQIEILYSDYIDNQIDGIELFKESDSKKITKIGQYQFKDVIEGFNSYLDRDELGINRTDLLENIKNLEKLSEENSNSDLFVDYIKTYNKFLSKISELTNDWQYINEDNSDEEEKESLFGRSVLQIFSKPQTLSAFGASIGKLKDKNVINGFDEIDKIIESLKITTDIDSTMKNLLKKLNEIKIDSKKIGVSQRAYFTQFFRELFNKNSDSYESLNESIESGYQKYSSFM